MNAYVFFRRPVAVGLASSAQRSHAVAKAKAKGFLNDDDGATMVEYAFMVMLIAIVCVAAVSTIGSDLSTVYNAVANDF